MNSLELFSGAGGLAKGLELAGFNHSAFVEYNKDACATLRLNFDPDKVFEGDVRDYDFNLLSNSFSGWVRSLFHGVRSEVDSDLSKSIPDHGCLG